MEISYAFHIWASLAQRLLEDLDLDGRIRAEASTCPHPLNSSGETLTPVLRRQMGKEARTMRFCPSLVGLDKIRSCEQF